MRPLLIEISCSGWSTDSGRNMTAFTIVNMPVIALIPNASVNTADAANTGARRSARSA